MTVTAKTKLTLPYPPTLNNLYFNTAKGRRLSKQGKQFKDDVFLICLSQKIKPMSGLLKVEIKAYRPRKVGDIDNLFKACLDSLKGSAFKDDSQIVDLRATRYDDSVNPRLEVEISTVNELQSEFIR